jgi:hypothetical protein
VFTWPLAARLGTAGRVDSGDGRFSVWNVAWVARTLTTAPGELFDANIFYPHPNALAFSEPNLVAGVLAIPVWLLTGNPLAAANSVVIIAFAAAMLATAALVGRLARSTLAGLLGGLFFAFSPYAFSHIPHVQLLMTFGLPLSLLALHRFVEAPGSGRAAALGGALALQGLACGYYGVFAALAVGWGMLWFAATEDRWRSARYWTLAAAAALVALGIVWPFLEPLEAIRSAGFARTIDDARLYSADWRAYLASPLLMETWILPIIGHWAAVKSPGLVPLGLALYLIVRWTTRRGAGPLSSRVAGFYLSLGVLAVWASFGPDAGLYRLLFETLPFFSLLRAPARFGVLATLAVAVLASAAAAELHRRSKRAVRPVAVIVLLGLAFAKSTVGPLPIVNWEVPRATYGRLEQLPPGAVAEFPFFSAAGDRHRHTEYMIASTLHWKPLINGYSDHFPGETVDQMSVLARFPDPEAWDVLRARGARYVVVHWNKYPPGWNPHARIQQDYVGRYVRVVLERPDASLYEITAWPDHAAD